MNRPRCVISPNAPDALTTAVTQGGGEVVEAADAEAVIWTDSQDAQGLEALLTTHPKIRWVQLPFAGVETFAHLFDTEHRWTSGRGIYAEPVAEHALMMGLAGLRGGVQYARQTTWGDPHGYNLYDGKVTIVGGGQIARELMRLMEPFRVEVTVVRNRPQPMEGAARVLPASDMVDAVRGADLVVLALALTPESDQIVDAAVLEAMEPHAWLVNIARGRHVDTDALVEALKADSIGGAALDVTDPEPLPDGHPLWELPNALITPHTANTPRMRTVLLAGRVKENVQRFAAGEPLLGEVDIELGY